MQLITTIGGEIHNRSKNEIQINITPIISLKHRAKHTGQTRFSPVSSPYFRLSLVNKRSNTLISPDTDFTIKPGEKVSIDILVEAEKDKVVYGTYLVQTISVYGARFGDVIELAMPYQEFSIAPLAESRGYTKQLVRDADRFRQQIEELERKQRKPILVAETVEKLDREFEEFKQKEPDLGIFSENKLARKSAPVLKEIVKSLTHTLHEITKILQKDIQRLHALAEPANNEELKLIAALRADLASRARDQNTEGCLQELDDLQRKAHHNCAAISLIQNEFSSYRERVSSLARAVEAESRLLVHGDLKAIQNSVATLERAYSQYEKIKGEIAALEEGTIANLNALNEEWDIALKLDKLKLVIGEMNSP